jgi:two-component system, chemotaxis family, sensor kinase CheA
MDDLLNEFLTETRENLDQLDREIVQLEQDPRPELLSSIFRMMHTIKGTCGFLGLPRLEGVAHAAENILGKVRDKELSITPHAVSMILEAIDQIKFLVAMLEESGQEPDGNDSALIASLNALAVGNTTPAMPDTAAAMLSPAAAAANSPASAPASSTCDTLFEEGDDILPSSAVLATGETRIHPAADAVTPRREAAHAPASSSPALATDAGKKDRDSGQSIRVNLDLLENLMNMVSELVLTRNQLLQIARTRNQDELTVPLQRLSYVTTELQEGVMKTRMQPIGNAWNKLPRLIRDLSLDLHKKIDLVMAGEETELDRQVLEMIKDPLTHMVRNSADHGIETPQERVRAGKSDTGTIRLEAYHEGGHIIIRIADDGKGLSLGKIKEKALKNGLVTPDELAEMTISQIQQFIFKPGFSTAAQVTSVSGRGVGMDVVRTNIEKIGGTIELTSEEGKGSVFLIKIPLTLAIVSALIVGVGRERFAIPQLAVVELVRVNSTSEHRIETVNGAPVLRLRGRLLPLVSLRQALNLEENNIAHGPRSIFIVVAQVGAHSFGMIVDKVFDTEEIVVKPVAPILKDISLFSGNTILGDGSVIMILDPNGIAAKTGELTVAESGTTGSSRFGHESHHEETVALLVFSAGCKTPRAVPLALVARLEEIDVQNIEYGNGRPLVQYRGALMPLVTLSPDYKIRENGTHPVLVFADGKRAMGMLTDEIIDIVEEVINVNLPSSEQKGLIGSAIIRGHATDLIDAHYFINTAFADWFRKTEKVSEVAHPNTKRLLLVDDSAFFRNLLTPVLHVAGYQVTTVENPLHALKLRDEGQTFDLIISDIEMPEMDGFAFAEKVRQDHLWGDTPLIALSAHINPEDMNKGHAVGFDDYVAKFDRDALLQTIRGIFGELPLAA